MGPYSRSRLLALLALLPLLALLAPQAGAAPPLFEGDPSTFAAGGGVVAPNVTTHSAIEAAILEQVASLDLGNGFIDATPVVLGSTAFVLSGGTYPDQPPKLHAIDLESLTLRWSVGLPPGAGFETSTPAIVGPSVVVASSAGVVQARAFDDGALLWEHAESHSLYGITGGVAPIGDDLLVATWAGDLVRLHGADGSVRWRTALGSPSYFSTPTVCAQGSGLSVAIGTDDGALSALAAEDGHLLWRRLLEGQVRSSATCLGGSVFVTTLVKEGATPRDGALWALSSDDGSLRWVERIGPSATTPRIDGTGTRVLVGTHLGALMALSVADGSVLWQQDLGAPVHAAPVWDASGQALALTDANDAREVSTLWVLSPQGEPLGSWPLHPPQFALASPQVVHGAVLLGSDSGQLHLLGTPRRAQLGVEVVTVAQGTILCASSKGDDPQAFSVRVRVDGGTWLVPQQPPTDGSTKVCSGIIDAKAHRVEAHLTQSGALLERASIDLPLPHEDMTDEPAKVVDPPSGDLATKGPPEGGAVALHLPDRTPSGTTGAASSIDSPAFVWPLLGGALLLGSAAVGIGAWRGRPDAPSGAADDSPARRLRRALRVERAHHAHRRRIQRAVTALGAAALLVSLATLAGVLPDPLGGQEVPHGSVEVTFVLRFGSAQPQGLAPGDYLLRWQQTQWQSQRSEAQQVNVTVMLPTTARSVEEGLREVTRLLGWHVRVSVYPFGRYVESIGGVVDGADGRYWIYLIDGAYVPRGASAQPLAQGMVITWVYGALPSGGVG